MNQRKFIERLSSRKFLLAASYLIFTVLTTMFNININEQIYWASVVVAGVFIGIEGLIDKSFLSKKAQEKIDDMWKDSI